MCKRLINSPCLGLVLVLLSAGIVGAADVTPQVYVDFVGALDGGGYALAPGELDMTGTFAAHNGTEIVSDGLGILSDADGASQENFQFDASSFNGNGSEFTGTAFIAEAIFTRTAACDAMAPVIDIGGQCFIRFHTGLSAGSWNGSVEISNNNIQVIPDVGQTHHYAIVYDGIDTIDYYLDGVAIFQSGNGSPQGITQWVSWGNIRHPSVDGGRQIRGEYDAVAFSTFTGSFDPDTDFILPEGLVPSAFAIAIAPKKGSMIDTTQTTLEWRAGEFASSHDVYLGESHDEVDQATPDSAVFQGSQTATTFGATNLTPGQTYYWRVDEVNDTEPNSPWKGSVWSFTVQPQTAWGPFPVDGMRNVDPDQDLTWEGGMGVLFHTVYFGQSFEEVDTAPFGFMSAEATYDPGTLQLDTTYYWRVDEFAFPANATFKGPVWSFTTRGEGGGVKAEYFDGVALAGDPIVSQIEPQIDHEWGTGEVAGGLSDLVSARWRANLEAPFTETYRLITTSDDGVRLWLDGRLIIENWTDHSTTDNTARVDLVAGQYYMIEMEYYDNSGGAVAQLSWQSDTLPHGIITQGWLQLPLRATSPSPAHLDPHADQASILTWAAGDDATGHDVYFGDDAEAVAAADTTTTGIYRGRQAPDATSFNPGPLEWGKTYYWRVDEVNPDGVLTGALWSFTAADFLIVEDFESYDDADNRIYQTWIDGAGNTTGSYVGYPVADNGTFGETVIVHGGGQSMPLDYNNVIPPFYSETDRTFDTPQDWTVNGVDTLVLYVRGSAANDPEPLYVGVEDSAGRLGVVVHPDPAITTAGGWNEWKIPLSEFANAGVNLAVVKKMYIGLGDRDAPAPGGAGLIFIDDIRVTRP